MSGGSYLLDQAIILFLMKASRIWSRVMWVLRKAGTFLAGSFLRMNRNRLKREQITSYYSSREK